MEGEKILAGFSYPLPFTVSYSFSSTQPSLLSRPPISFRHYRPLSPSHPTRPTWAHPGRFDDVSFNEIPLLF